jgi:hypothetical protein
VSRGIGVPERPHRTHPLRMPPWQRSNLRGSARNSRLSPCTGACGRESGSFRATSGQYHRDGPAHGWSATGRHGCRRHKLRSSQRGSTRASRRRQRWPHDRPGRRRRASRRLGWGRRRHHRLACCRLDLGNRARKRRKVESDLVQFPQVEDRLRCFDCGGRGYRSSRTLSKLLGRFTPGAKMRPDFVGKIVIERTRMGLLVRDTDLDQVLQDPIALNFQFTRQFVDPYLTHAKFFFSLALAQTLGYGNLPAGSIKALAALFHAPPPPSPDAGGSSLLSPSPSPSGVLA